MLTSKDNAVYRPLVRAAWQAYCSRRAIAEKDRGAYDRWYRQVLVRTAGIYTTKQAMSIERFEALCLAFATIAGDEKQIDYWTKAPERRALWRLCQTMKKAGVSDDYVRGIARKMNFGDGPIEDLPAELILKLNTAVYLHAKRKGAIHAHTR